MSPSCPLSPALSPSHVPPAVTLSHVPPATSSIPSRVPQLSPRPQLYLPIVSPYHVPQLSPILSCDPPAVTTLHSHVPQLCPQPCPLYPAVPPIPSCPPSCDPYPQRRPPAVSPAVSPVPRHVPPAVTPIHSHVPQLCPLYPDTSLIPQLSPLSPLISPSSVPSHVPSPAAATRGQGRTRRWRVTPVGTSFLIASELGPPHIRPRLAATSRGGRWHPQPSPLTGPVSSGVPGEGWLHLVPPLGAFLPSLCLSLGISAGTAPSLETGTVTGPPATSAGCRRPSRHPPSLRWARTGTPPVTRQPSGPP